MCGVVGYIEKKYSNDNIDILYKIIGQSKIRGLHSFGYSYYTDKIVTNKYHTLTNIVLPDAKKIIYHNRYATSGDYQEHINNQPIVRKDRSLVFNGVLDMRTKQEMQKAYNIVMQTDNDGEILLQKCKSKNDIIKFVTNTKGSFAGLILHKDKLYAIRNAHRPLWRLETDTAIYYASTKDIFKRVDKTYKPIELKPNIIYED